MARIHKEGIDYFPMDGDFLNNRKIRRLIREHGPEAIAVILAVFSATYSGKGYYLEWNEDVCFDLSEQTNTKTKTVQAIIVSAMHQQLFDTEVFKKEGVLTSERIQKQYLQCTQKRKNVALKEEYILVKDGINSPQTLFSGEEMGVSAPQTQVSDTEITQSKGKERESKVKQKEQQTTPTPRSKVPQPNCPTGEVVGLSTESEELKGGSSIPPSGGKEEEWMMVDGRKVPQYCLNKRTHNYDGLLYRLNQIHVTDVKVVNTILKFCDYGKLGHPLWGIISYNNWPTYGIKFPGKFILSQLKLLE